MPPTPQPPPSPAMSEIERRIIEAIRGATADGLVPKSLYLTPDDRAQLRDALGYEPETVADLAVRCVSGRGKSRLYCRRGITRSITTKPKGWRR